MSQFSLFPIKLLDEFPADPAQSRDLLFTAIDAQDRRYALKTREPGNPELPITEWMCYHLCELLGIPTPEFAVVERLDGTLAFGSRWELDATQFNKDEHSEAMFARWVEDSSKDISAIYALDAFLPNDDRHAGNFLFRLGPRLRALAFDWSRAKLFLPWPWDADCNSAGNWNWITHLGLHRPDTIRQTLDTLCNIEPGKIEHILNQAPREWLDEARVQHLVEWWATSRHARAADVEGILLS